MGTVDSQIIVKSKFCEFKEKYFLRFLILRTWSTSYTLKVAALIIANFNFASEAKRKKRKFLTNAIFTEFTVCLALPEKHNLALQEEKNILTR